uniref:PPM-type phosphatase domain-containing protein n=1 Tax=Macrostomum lignano TaxID=282301 RepID=A0A1I8I002_9PLAT
IRFDSVLNDGLSNRRGAAPAVVIAAQQFRHVEFFVRFAAAVAIAVVDVVNSDAAGGGYPQMPSGCRRGEATQADQQERAGHPHQDAWAGRGPVQVAGERRHQHFACQLAADEKHGCAPGGQGGRSHRSTRPVSIGASPTPVSRAAAHSQAWPAGQNRATPTVSKTEFKPNCRAGARRQRRQQHRASRRDSSMPRYINPPTWSPTTGRRWLRPRRKKRRGTGRPDNHEQTASSRAAIAAAQARMMYRVATSSGRASRQEQPMPETQKAARRGGGVLLFVNLANPLGFFVKLHFVARHAAVCYVFVLTQQGDVAGHEAAADSAAAAGESGQRRQQHAKSAGGQKQAARQSARRVQSAARPTCTAKAGISDQILSHSSTSRLPMQAPASPAEPSTLGELGQKPAEQGAAKTADSSAGEQQDNLILARPVGPGMANARPQATPARDMPAYRSNARRPPPQQRDDDRLDVDDSTSSDVVVVEFKAAAPATGRFRFDWPGLRLDSSEGTGQPVGRQCLGDKSDICPGLHRCYSCDSSDDSCDNRLLLTLHLLKLGSCRCRTADWAGTQTVLPPPPTRRGQDRRPAGQADTHRPWCRLNPDRQVAHAAPVVFDKHDKQPLIGGSQANAEVVGFGRWQRLQAAACMPGTESSDWARCIGRIDPDTANRLGQPNRHRNRWPDSYRYRTVVGVRACTYYTGEVGRSENNWPSSMVGTGRPECPDSCRPDTGINSRGARRQAGRCQADRRGSLVVGQIDSRCSWPVRARHSTRVTDFTVPEFAGLPVFSITTCHWPAGRSRQNCTDMNGHFWKPQSPLLPSSFRGASSKERVPPGDTSDTTATLIGSPAVPCSTRVTDFTVPEFAGLPVFSITTCHWPAGRSRQNCTDMNGHFWKPQSPLLPSSFRGASSKERVPPGDTSDTYGDDSSMPTVPPHPSLTTGTVSGPLGGTLRFTITACTGHRTRGGTGRAHILASMTMRSADIIPKPYFLDDFSPAWFDNQSASVKKLESAPSTVPRLQIVLSNAADAQGVNAVSVAVATAAVGFLAAIAGCPHEYVAEAAAALNPFLKRGLSQPAGPVHCPTVVVRAPRGRIDVHVMLVEMQRGSLGVIRVRVLNAIVQYGDNAATANRGPSGTGLEVPLLRIVRIIEARRHSGSLHSNFGHLLFGPQYAGMPTNSMSFLRIVETLRAAAQQSIVSIHQAHLAEQLTAMAGCHLQQPISSILNPAKQSKMNGGPYHPVSNEDRRRLALAVEEGRNWKQLANIVGIKRKTAKTIVDTCVQTKHIEKLPAVWTKGLDEMFYKLDELFCTLRAAQVIREASGSKKAVQSGLKEFLFAEGQSVTKFFTAEQWQFFRKQPNGQEYVIERSVVFCRDVYAFLAHVSNSRGTAEMHQRVKLAIDRGGNSLKVCISVTVDDRGCTSSAQFNRFMDSGVKKILILALVEDVKECYQNVSVLMATIDISSINFTLACDFKLANITSGIQSHSSSHPCLYCEGRPPWEVPAQRGCSAQFDTWQPPLLPGSDSAELLDVVPPPELHMMLGIGSNKAYEWAYEAGICRQQYHGGCLEGPACKKLLLKASELWSVLPPHLKLYATALQDFNAVREACFGQSLAADYSLYIARFQTTCRYLELSVTPKMHTLFDHVPAFCGKRRPGTVLLLQLSMLSQLSHPITMGQSLSEPVTAKETSLKQTANLLIGSSAMQGWRPRMEDAHAVHTRLSSPAPPAVPRPAAAQPAVTYAGVFDGHGGAKVARYAAEHLHRRLAAAGAAAPLSESSSPDAVEPIRAAFLEVDRDLRLRRADGGAGSTALVLLVDDSTIRCASVGDSRAVLSVAGRPVQLSRDHHPGASAERARILAAGGRVVGGRVNGRLAISRALGDFSFKRSGKRPPSEQMVTADPSVCVQTITDSMEFVVMASDGVWEVMSNQEVVSFVRSRLARGMNPDARSKNPGPSERKTAIASLQHQSIRHNLKVKSPIALRNDCGPSTVAAGRHLRFTVSAARLCHVILELEAGLRRPRRAAKAHVASFDTASGDCALLECDRGSRDHCRRCRHEGYPSLPILWDEPLPVRSVTAKLSSAPQVSSSAGPRSVTANHLQHRLNYISASSLQRIASPASRPRSSDIDCSPADDHFYRLQRTGVKS